MCNVHLEEDEVHLWSSDDFIVLHLEHLETLRQLLVTLDWLVNLGSF